MEALLVGDRVVTAAGEARAIVWTGNSIVDCRSYADPSLALPIRVAVDAFGVGQPSRELELSPLHAVCVSCVEDVLVPVGKLVNGTTIARMKVDEVSYWHVELESHDILVANGLPSESYLERGNRGFFQGVTTEVLPDGFPSRTDDFCRPLIDNGPVLAAIRMQLNLRAAQLGWIGSATETSKPTFFLHKIRRGGVAIESAVGRLVSRVWPRAAQGLFVRLLSKRG